MQNDLLIFIPTYNERENVESILSKVLNLGITADILFIDDNSPDGTGRVLDQLAGKFPNLFVEHRSRKQGIGSAHANGIQWAYSKGYLRLITMDCDFTHSPDYIPEFLAKGEGADIVVGSRYLQRDGLRTWNIFRKTLTHLGHMATRFFLNMPYDATGAFRLYRLDKVSRHFLHSVHATGYAFFFESLHILHLNGYQIAEIPMDLPSRAYGHSKMRTRDALDSLCHLAHTYFTTLVNRERFEITEPCETHPVSNEPEADDWDVYWSRKETGPLALSYDLLAAFYRKFIIKPCLTHFILKYFNNHDALLHAGCGSGQVDQEVGSKISITALDLSAAALTIYKKANTNYRQLVRGSILEIPLLSDSFDGIYNLGVMEHFQEHEIERILLEFNRVLKPDGRVLLFWPPEFGFSVIILKVIHSVLHFVLRRKIQLHPTEFTRIKSRTQAEGYLRSAGFSLVEYSFGVRDLFTHAVIVGVKTAK